VATSQLTGDLAAPVPPPFRFDVPLEELAAPARLAALEETGLAVVGQDEQLDRLTRLAAAVTSAPVVMVSVVGPTRTVLASGIGIPLRLADGGIPLDQSLCQHVAVNERPLVVDDLRAHPHLADHPSLTELGVVAYAGFPVRHPDGAVIATICVADTHPRRWGVTQLSGLVDLAGLLERDVAERVERWRAEREDRRDEVIHDQRVLLERLQALDRERAEFVATASHELRTPVASIHGYAELLLDGVAGELDEQQVDFVSRIGRNSGRLLSLIRDLLALDQLEHDEREPVRETVDVGAVAARVWDQVSAELAGRHLDTRLVLPPVPVLVRGDASEIEQVTTHLLGNALKFTFDGGSVELAVRRTSETVVLTVTDTGIGIGAADHRRVFEPFKRTHEAQQRAIQGPGLGLTLVRKLVEAADGTVSLDSALGRGTRVVVELPCLPDIGVRPVPPRD
jgi:signal transduction histidine kinase